MLALLLAVAARHQTIYVSANGLDSNPGSRAAPLATVEAAVEKARLEICHRIIVEAGTYQLSKTVELDSQDSGLLIRGERATLTGSVAVPASAIKKCEDEAVLNRIVDPKARSKVMEVDLKPFGIDHLPPIEPRGFPHPPHPEFNELFHDGKPLRLARWPNEGYATVQTAIDPGSGEADQGKPPRNPVFTIGDRAKLWAAEKDAWFYGYWKYDWADESIRAENISAGGTVTLANPHVYGVEKGAPFFAENLLEELDSPGEYWIDRDADKLYFLEDRPGIRSGYRLSLLGLPILRVSGARNIAIDGFSFAYSRGDAVHLEDCTDTRIANCDFKCLGERAATIEGGRLCEIKSCTIESTGEGGIALGGGDRKTLTPADNRAFNCDIQDYERLSQTYRPGVLISGDGNAVVHCVIHDAPHSAIIFSGNNHTIEFNEFYRTISRTGDGGVIYTGRDWTARGTKIDYNYFHDNIGLRKWEPAIYLDDLACGISANGNLIERCHWGFLIGGGRNNRIENNVIVDCDLGFDCDARGLGWGKSMLPTLMDRLKAVPYQTPPWSTAYPALATILDHTPLAPSGNVIARNLLVRSGTLMQEMAPEFAASANLTGNYETREALGMNFLTDPHDHVWRNLPGFIMLPVERMGLFGKIAPQAANSVKNP